MTATGWVLSTATVLVMGNLLSPFLQPESRAVEEGLRKYREGDWVGAVERFQQALDAEPAAGLQYNLGAAAYQGQNYPEALRAYAAAAGSGEIPAGRAAYDLGNALYQNQNLAEALQAYRQALREDPGNEDARFNYELTLRQLTNQEQNEDPEQSQDQQGDSQESGESQQGEGQAPPDSSRPSSPQEPRSEDEQEPQPPASGEQDQKEQEQRNAAEADQEPQDQMLNSQEAMRLLNAVSPEERELIKARLKAGKRRAVEKDW